MSTALWVRPEECLWDAPLDFLTKYPLKAVLKTVLQCSLDEMATLFDFFQTTLCVPLMAWADLVTELSVLREEEDKGTSHIQKIYQSIHKMVNGSELNDLR